MNNKIYIELKNSLYKTKKSEQHKLEKTEQKVKIGTEKAYLLIWKDIIKNIKKECFEICIHVFSNKKCNYIYAIKVNNEIKNISKIPVKLSELSKMLFLDGLTCPMFRDMKSRGFCTYKFTVLRVDLENIIKKTEKNEVIKILK